jgi:glucose-1-phosphate thymidylyltransferase
MNVIGLIPAAGRATRLPMLPCSKEIYPIGTFKKVVEDQIIQYPKPVIAYLIERLILAGVQKTIITTSKEKSDILRLLGDGSAFNMHLAYLIQEENNGMPYALNLAHPWVNDSIILFGMPDTIFFPENAFVTLLDRLISTKADLTLGLFPTDKPSKFGMVNFDNKGNFIYTIDKPDSTDLKFMWGIACWGYNFNSFMNEYIKNHLETKELVLGTVIQAAHDSGLRVNVLPFFDGAYYDIGTPEDLQKAIALFS